MTAAQAQHRHAGTRIFTLMFLGLLLLSASWVSQQPASLSGFAHHAVVAAGLFDGLAVDGGDSLRVGSRTRDGDDSSDGNDGFFDHLSTASRVSYAFELARTGGSSPSLHFAVSQRYRLPVSRAPPRV